MRPGARQVEEGAIAPHPLAGPSWAVYGALLFAVTAWGGSFVAARLVLAPEAPDQAALSPTLLATVRFGLAALLFLPLLARRPRGGPSLRLADAPAFLGLGFLGISLYFWLQYTGLRLTNAGLAAVLVVGLVPLATMLVAALALHERLGGRRLLALGLGTLGFALVVSQRDLQVALESGFLLGALCLVANAFCFAVYSTLVRGLRRRYPPLTLTAGMTVAGSLLLVALSLPSEDWATLGALSPRQWLAIAYLALICSVLAYVFYNFALSRLEAGKVSAWLYLEPPIALALGGLCLGEVVAAQTVLGGLVILAGLLLLQRS
ncbi:MAG: DMT family transporter [Chloroflexota bacterium]